MNSLPRAVASTTEPVRIHYRRPPGREDVFVQQLVERTPDCVITYLGRTALGRNLVVNERVVLDDGAPAIWFTFPGRWHDIGRFHRLDGTFTGTYANILTPVRFTGPSAWETTDLFLDLWTDDRGTVVLDEAEFEHAVAQGWLDEATARRAREEADALADQAAAGAWPPAIVEAWPLERVLERLQARNV